MSLFVFTVHHESLAFVVFHSLSNGVIIMFKIGQIVKRSPKFWKNDTATFKVLEYNKGVYRVQRQGKTKNDFTGKMEAHKPTPYLATELVAL
jgi:hypothetical protein